MSLLAFVLFYVLFFVQAVPLVKRIVVNPQITNPSSSTIWTVNEEVTVQWDTTNLPPGNFTGQLLLGNLTSDSENLDIDHPLAVDFPLSAGSVEFTVPIVKGGTHFIVVLFGDSGNRSPPFTITSGSNNTSASSTSTSTPPFLTPLSPIPVSPRPFSSPPSSSSPSSAPPVSSPSPLPVTPTSTSTPPSPTATSPSAPVSSSSSTTPTSSSASTNTPSTTGSTSSSNSALPALNARGANAISLCVAAAAMSLVLVL